MFKPSLLAFALGLFLFIGITASPQAQVVDVNGDGLVGPEEAIELSKQWKQAASQVVGSSTDAQLLDGLDSTQFLRRDVSDTFSGPKLIIDGALDIGVPGASSHDVRIFGAAFPGAKFFWDASNASTAMGYQTTASGRNSLATGFGATASGAHTTAMGFFSTASGYQSIATGRGAIASATDSTAMGTYTTASGKYSTAIGRGAIASATGSTAMGGISSASGDYSTAMGFSTTASGAYSTAMGFSTTASGRYSTATGHLSNASGRDSTAMGYQTTASGNYSTATGLRTTAGGNYSTAMGALSTASGINSTAIGRDTTASGANSTAMGDQTIASGSESTAMGIQTTASGIRSTAMGVTTTASEFASTAMGFLTTASGDASTAMGRETQASGNYSTAMGVETIASGRYSTALGSGITAQGIGSVAIALSNAGGVVLSQNNTMAIIGGKVGIQNLSPTHMLDVGQSGAYCDGMAWVDGSSRDYKKDIQPLSEDDLKHLISTLDEVEMVKYLYKQEAEGTPPRVGMIAEEMPEALATENRKGLDTGRHIGFLMGVVKAMRAEIEDQQVTITEMREELNRLSGIVDSK